MLRYALGSILLLVALSTLAADPKCDGPDNWAASMVHAGLKNEGLIDNYSVDFSKTKVVRLASEKIGKDLYKQVHRVSYFMRNGEVVEAIAVNEASHEECSMSGVEIFVISRHIAP